VRLLHVGAVLKKNDPCFYIDMLLILEGFLSHESVFFRSSNGATRSARL